MVIPALLLNVRLPVIRKFTSLVVFRVLPAVRSAAPVMLPPPLTRTTFCWALVLSIPAAQVKSPSTVRVVPATDCEMLPPSMSSPSVPTSMAAFNVSVPV
jgi:hypothetical protein